MFKQPHTPNRTLIKTALAVFAAAFAVRLIYAAQAWTSPLFQEPTLDADAYYQLAREFASGRWLSPIGEPYWQPPFYPMALALWMKLAGPSVLGIKTAQMALGSANCALVYLLGRRVFGARVGLAAGIAAALYGPMIYFDGELLTPTLQTFLNLLALLVVMKAVETRRLWLFCATGLVLGFSVITRPDSLLLLAGICAWAAVRMYRQSGLRASAAACALLSVCAIVPVVPIAVRNYTVGEDAVLISSNGGINFFIGNNPNEAQTRNIRPGPDWDALQALPMKENPDAKPSRQSAWFYREALKYAANRPLAYAALQAKKTIAYISAVEGRRNNDVYYYGQHSPLYAALMWRRGGFGFPFGILLPMAILGMAARPQNRGAGLLYIYLAAQFVSVVAFFVCSRYRVPAAPVLLIFAAAGGLQLWRALRERRVREIAVPVLSAILVFVISNLNLCGVDADRRPIDADTQLYLGYILENRREPSAALDHYRRAVALNPDNEVSRFHLADLLARTGAAEEAKRHLLAALRINPESPASNARLAEILEEQGDLAGAIGRFAKAAETDPMFAKKLTPLAERAYSEAEYDLAISALRAIVRAEPGWADARRSLGVCLMKAGMLTEAVGELERACELEPGSAECFIALGLAHRELGQMQEAEAAFDRAVSIGPENEIRAKIDSRVGMQRGR